MLLSILKVLKLFSSFLKFLKFTTTKSYPIEYLLTIEYVRQLYFSVQFEYFSMIICTDIIHRRIKIINLYINAICIQ